MGRMSSPAWNTGRPSQRTATIVVNEQCPTLAAAVRRHLHHPSRHLPADALSLLGTRERVVPSGGAYLDCDDALTTSCIAMSNLVLPTMPLSHVWLPSAACSSAQRL